MKKNVTILGDGAWGTAVATLLAHNGYNVVIWCHNADVAEEINTRHTNSRFLPDIMLDAKIVATTDMARALQNTHNVFEAVPVKYLRTVLEHAKPWYKTDQTWILLSKGIEQGSLLLPSTILDDVFGGTVHKAVVSGPSFAHDLARKQITGVTVAAPDTTIADAVSALLANDYLRPSRSSDIIGVQVGGAIKNVITLAMGMLDGAGYGDNTKAFVLTRGLQEMATLAIALGGHKETVYGLSGVGDLVLTATGMHSKNMKLGRELGQGKRLEDLVTNGAMPEGVNTTQSVHQLARKHNLTLPICNGVYQVLFESKSVQDMLHNVVR
jgi:glycerol-3-phosphate dehydrogenase (NAD(P)+)